MRVDALYKYESPKVLQGVRYSGVNEFPFLQCDKVGGTVVPLDLGALKSENVRMNMVGIRKVIYFSTYFVPSCFIQVISFHITYIQSQRERCYCPSTTNQETKAQRA